jgi:hypothetical protein
MSENFYQHVTNNFEINDSLARRFWMRVDKKDASCWEWLGAKDGKGYGTIRSSRKRLLAHRVSYLLHNGNITIGKVICHSCDNKLCVNPAHLFEGTQKDNVYDAVKKGIIPNSEKLTDNQKSMIVSRLDLGVKQKDVAKEFNVSQSLISIVKRGIGHSFYKKSKFKVGGV